MNSSTRLVRACRRFSNQDWRINSAGAAIALTFFLNAGSTHAEALSTPPISPPLAANDQPMSVDAGPFGRLSVTGAVTGIGYVQNHGVAGDKTSRIDVSNAQVFLQTTEGPVRFYVQAGVYSIPTIGAPYLKATDTTEATFGAVPQAYVTFAPNESFSIQAGKIPTLIGAEYTFSFQNTNITRGVVWNQENAVNRGVQVNYSTGPISVSVSVNDGFYSNRFSWVSGLVAFAIDESNTLAIAAGGNLSDTGIVSSATPLFQNNSDILNVVYTHTSGPLTLTPYFQYTRVGADAGLGILTKGETVGFALLGKYSFNENFSLGFRGEYIDTKAGTTNLLYGAGSKAWTATLTPTYQIGAFFVRGEFAYIKASDIAAGAAFGPAGLNTSQTRGLIETGFLF